MKFSNEFRASANWTAQHPVSLAIPKIANGAKPAYAKEIAEATKIIRDYERRPIQRFGRTLVVGSVHIIGRVTARFNFGDVPILAIRPNFPNACFAAVPATRLHGVTFGDPAKAVTQSIRLSGSNMPRIARHYSCHESDEIGVSQSARSKNGAHARGEAGHSAATLCAACRRRRTASACWPRSARISTR